MEEKNQIQALYSSFVFVGTPIIPKEDARIPFYMEGKSESGFVWNKINFSVKTSETNSVFVELNGGYFDNGKHTIKTQDNDKNKIEIPWKDRFNKAIMDKVANFKKLGFDFDGSDYNSETKIELLAEYDAVKYIKDKLPTTTDKRIVVTGNVRYDRYKDKNSGTYKTSIHYVIKNVRLAREEEESKAECKLGLIFEKDSWDESGLKDDKKVYVNGYVTSYDRELKDNVFIPMMYTINFNNFDMDSEVFKTIFNLYKKYFTENVKRNEYYQTEWEGRIFKGAEQKEITIEDLSQEQQIQISCGMATFEQIKKDMRNKLIGDRLNEVRLIRPTNAFDGSPNSLTSYEEQDFIVNNEVADESMDDMLKTLDDNNPIGDDGLSQSELDILGLFKTE